MLVWEAVAWEKNFGANFVASDSVSSISSANPTKRYDCIQEKVQNIFLSTKTSFWATSVLVNALVDPKDVSNLNEEVLRSLDIQQSKHVKGGAK